MLHSISKHNIKLIRFLRSFSGLMLNNALVRQLGYGFLDKEADHSNFVNADTAFDIYPVEMSSML